jgi:hypothetical protein
MMTDDRYRRAADRWRTRSKDRTQSSNVLIGFVLIGVGAVLLLKNYGVFSTREVMSYWPLLPIIWGVLAIGRSRSTFTYMIGGLAIGLGTLKLLDNLDIIEISSKLYPPILMISLGVAFLVFNLKGDEIRKDTDLSVLPTIHPMAIFGAIQQRVDSQEFEGGEVLALFGGVELDFRKAKLKSKTAMIEANAVFGGCQLKIPESWVVEVRGTAVFGGYENKTLAPRPEDGSAPTLIVTGNAVFGGVSIEN